MKTIYSLLLVVFWSFPEQTALSEDAPKKLPTLSGKITFTEGSFFGYGPPRVGDSLNLDLQQLDSIRGKLSFSGPELSYVVLSAPLRIDKLERLADGGLLSARLVSIPEKGSWRVTIDIQRYGAFSPPRAKVWIVGESTLITSVARLECELLK